VNRRLRQTQTDLPFSGLLEDRIPSLDGALQVALQNQGTGQPAWQSKGTKVFLDRTAGFQCAGRIDSCLIVL
jgi:hypothetical protein